MGVFITLEEATGPMKAEAVKAGSYQSPDFYGGAGKKYQRIQILTIEQLLRGEEIKMPPPGLAYKQAQKVQQSGQTSMDLD